MQLSDYLKEDAIRLDLETDSKQGFFKAALAHLHECGYVSEPEKVLEDLDVRENIMSTGIGLGIAIPHAQSEGVTTTHLSFWRSSRTIDFDAMDKQPVDLIFMILGPRGIGNEHVKILAKISRVLHGSNLRERLRNTATPQDVLAIVREFEEN
ncbi:MAG: PTS sugar transporter subunit IIA [bacterium]|nr:PTS sugar transporter subunit IIA [bacterium]